MRKSMCCGVFLDSSSSVTEDKRKLASSLLCVEPFCNESLRDVFDRVIRKIETCTSKKIDILFRNQVWDEVAPDRLTSLKTIYIDSYCERVLNFDESKIKKMLADVINCGNVSNKDKEILQKMMQNHKQFLANKILVAAEATQKCLADDIIEKLMNKTTEGKATGKATLFSSSDFALIGACYEKLFSCTTK